MPGVLDPSGEQPGGMFQQSGVLPSEPPPWDSGLTNGAAPPGINLPQGMYYGIDPGWMSGGGPGTGEPDRPAGRPAFYAPGRPTEEFIAANSGLTRGDFENPLAYMIGGGGGFGFTQGGGGGVYQPRDTGGFFNLFDLFRNHSQPLTNAFGDHYPQNPPMLFQRGAEAPSTNNWRLMGAGPGWIMRNGIPINAASMHARQGQPLGGELGYGLSGENSIANYLRYSAPGSGSAWGAPNLVTIYGSQNPGITGWPGAPADYWVPTGSGNPS